MTGTGWRPWPSSAQMRLLIWALALVLAAGAAKAQTATLVVHNNTGATLTVFTQNAFDSGLESGEIVVAPESVAEGRVPMGQSVVFFAAERMTDPRVVTKNYNFLHSGRHEFEIFAADFGLSAMFDRPGAAPVAEAPGGPPRPSAEVLARLEALGIIEDVGQVRECNAPTLAPSWYLIDYVPFSGCPEGYIGGGTDPPGSDVSRWCGYCGGGYRGALDRFRCCVPLQ